MKVLTKRLVAKSCDFKPGRVYLSRYSSDDGYAVCNVGTQPPVESRREPWRIQGICECCCSAHARELERDFRLLLAAKAQAGFRGFRLTDYEADALFCLAMNFDWQFKGPSATDWPEGEKLRLDWIAAIVQAGKDLFDAFPEKKSAKLTPEEIRTISIARVASSEEVDSLLEIIDRITGTKWEISQENDR